MDQLQIAKSKGSVQCPEAWVCTNCGFSWCAACGFAFGSEGTEGGSNCSHVCSQTNNYIINSIVADIELIYTEYTRGTMNENGFRFHCLSIYSAVKKIRKVEKDLDSRAESVLKLLTNILQNKTENQVKPILGFSCSVLLSRGNVVGQLLEYLVTNDSMLDICARSALYLQLVDLLNTMLQYPELLKRLLGSKTDIRKGCHDDGEFGSDSSVIRKMRNIYKQSKIVVKRVKDGNENINVQDELGIARSLLECYERLVSAAEKQASSSPSANFVLEKDGSRMTRVGTSASDNTTLALGANGPISMENNDASSDDCKNVVLYKESLKLLQFDEYPFIGASSSVHTYSKYFDTEGSNPKRIDSTGVHNKKRMLHIAKEIASLATNLPLEWESSIHVRVDPMKMDLLKALIVGPKGTPYQNGIFIFDMYLPSGLLFRCRHTSSVNDFVTTCMHVTCKPCLKSHVESLVEKSIKSLVPSYEAIRIQLQCPNQRCGVELKTTYLLNLLDIDIVKNYENWLGNAIQRSRMSPNKERDMEFSESF